MVPSNLHHPTDNLQLSDSLGVYPQAKLFPNPGPCALDVNRPRVHVQPLDHRAIPGGNLLEHRNNESDQQCGRALADIRVLRGLVFDSTCTISILFPENLIYLTPARHLEDIQPKKETTQKT